MERRWQCLTQNKLKLIAAISMVLDHVGAELFPQVTFLRILGRLAFPLFSYFIYEGFCYTHSKGKYLLRVASLGILCVIVYYFVDHRLYGNTLITFALSILALLGIHALRSWSARSLRWKVLGVVVLVGSLLLPWLLCMVFPVDYGYFGVLAPVFAALTDHLIPRQNRYATLAGFAVGLLLLSVFMGGRQYFCLFALPLLLLYNGQRGTARLGHFFYWFYPVHLGIIGLIGMLVRHLAES